jgi:1-acyl-sn-glycerol-3-phosphate acyltransferase
MNSMTARKFIDTDRILKERSPSLYRWLPRFAINWLKKKLHEKQINEAMIRLENVHGLDFNIQGLKELGVRTEAYHVENIPASGGVIIASNHPLGGLDGMALIKAIGEKRPDVRFIVNDLLRKLENYRDVFVGVNKIGSTSRDALKVIEDVYASEAAVIVFPAGLVSRKQGGQIMDLEWNKSFVSKAIKYNKPIVPVFVEGENSPFFYNFALWRKRLGIKGNIEMLFLPDEMFKERKEPIRIHFGKPFSPDILDNSKTHQEWATLIKRYVYSSEFKKNISFEEFIKQKRPA